MQWMFVLFFLALKLEIFIWKVEIAQFQKIYL